MNIPLSKRLATCCSMIPAGATVSDIGCDHGYLSIYLLKNGIAKCIIAADIGELPLASAKANAIRFDVEENIRFYLSDGAMSIPRDFTHMVCAGMGADTMIHILENAPWLQNERYTLILQCQSKTPMLREYLSRTGYSILEETVLKDGRFLYTVMKICWKPGAQLTAGGLWISPALAASGSPWLPAYYKQTITKLQRAITGKKEQADPQMVAALYELENDPFLKELSYDNS